MVSKPLTRSVLSTNHHVFAHRRNFVDLSNSAFSYYIQGVRVVIDIVNLLARFIYGYSLEMLVKLLEALIRQVFEYLKGLQFLMIF